MAKHAMKIVQEVTEFFNPGQIPVIAGDCPIFSTCKYVQWKYPDTHGEDKMVMMLGGLHLEKALWTALGNLLDGSGWVESLIESGIATSGTAQSFLKASHITRTSYAHQVTALTLGKIQCDAFETTIKYENWESFEQWRLAIIRKCPTFQFWDLIRRIEVFTLIFVRAHREKIP